MPRTYVITFAGLGIRNGWVEVTLAGESLDNRVRPEQERMRRER